MAGISKLPFHGRQHKELPCELYHILLCSRTSALNKHDRQQQGQQGQEALTAQ
jgi:hypothetical protein